MALQGYLCQIKAQSTGVAMTDEATSTSDNINYQITATAKRIIDLNTTVVVEDDGVVTTESYTIDYLNGIIEFEDADSERIITVTGAYMTPTTVATADSYNYSLSADMYDNTAFNQAFKSFQPGIVSGSADLTRFHAVDDIFTDVILAGEYMILEFFVDATNNFLVYGLMTSDKVDSPVAGLIKESVSYQLTTQIGV